MHIFAIASLTCSCVSGKPLVSINVLALRVREAEKRRHGRLDNFWGNGVPRKVLHAIEGMLIALSIVSNLLAGREGDRKK